LNNFSSCLQRVARADRYILPEVWQKISISNQIPNYIWVKVFI
jgi:hypothetical protein